LENFILYSYPYARARAIESLLLKHDFYEKLISSRDINEIISYLMETHYREYLNTFGSKYSGIDLVEISVNSYITRISRIILNMTPRMSLDAVRAYIAKYDISNIKVILSSKVLGKPIKESEMFLLSENDIPVGIVAGTLSNEDFKILMNEDIEGAIKYLLKFPYGRVLMESMESFKKSNDIGELLISLDLFYYKNLKEKVRIFMGNELPVINLIENIIDSRNIMTILRAFSLGIPPNEIKNYLLDGGSLNQQKIEDLTRSSSIDEVVEKLREKFDLTHALEAYKNENDLKEFEIQLDKYIIEKNIPSFRISSPGLSSIIGLMLMFETERENIRKIAYSKLYNLSNERIKSMLVKVI